MATGEKRSLTSSLNKALPLFIDDIQGDVLSFKTKNDLLHAYYDFWMNYSLKQKVSWSKHSYHLETSFKSEMLIKFESLLADELQLIEQAKKEIQLPLLKSKKKRLRKKHEKKLMLLIAQ